VGAIVVKASESELEGFVHRAHRLGSIQLGERDYDFGPLYCTKFLVTFTTPFDSSSDAAVAALRAVECRSHCRN